MNKQLIKDTIAEMIESGELKVVVNVDKWRLYSDSFGNLSGGLEDIDVEVYLEVGNENRV